MFVMIGNIMFMFYCENYSSIFNAWTTVTNASMGNFDFTDFDQITTNIYLQIFGKIVKIRNRNRILNSELQMGSVFRISDQDS